MDITIRGKTYTNVGIDFIQGHIDGMENRMDDLQQRYTRLEYDLSGLQMVNDWYVRELRATEATTTLDEGQSSWGVFRSLWLDADIFHSKGLYILYRGNLPVYVGKATGNHPGGIAKRVCDHVKDKDFDAVLFLVAPPEIGNSEEMMCAAEAALIRNVKIRNPKSLNKRTECGMRGRSTEQEVDALLMCGFSREKAVSWANEANRRWVIGEASLSLRGKHTRQSPIDERVPLSLVPHERDPGEEG